MRASQPQIETALSIVTDEIDLVSTELDAFEDFLGRLRDVRVPSQQPGSVRSAAETTTLVAGTDTRTQPTALATIRTAYRDSVMDVPHYDTEYGDTLPESLATELGEPLANHVVAGDRLTSVVHDALVEATEGAITDRREFLSTLRNEKDSLEAVESELNAVETRAFALRGKIPDATATNELGTIEEELEQCERRCTEVAQRRQEMIHDRPRKVLSGVNEISLVRYLYGDLETQCPALAATVSVLETIRRHRRQCLR